MHSNKEVQLCFRPSTQPGIFFKRIDVTQKNNIIRADASAVCQTQGQTVLANQDGVRVATVEHLMAALYVLGIKDVIIEVNAQEIPIFDGSARPFVFFLTLLKTALPKGLKQKSIKIKQRVSVTDERGGKATLLPSANFCLEIRHSNPFDGTTGLYKTNNVYDSFSDEIAPARTFGRFEDAEKLRAVGLAKGANLSNTVVYKNAALMNNEGLRYPSELVRHKALDVVGDLALIGYRICGKFEGENTSHTLNHCLVSKLLSDKNTFEIV